MIRKIVLENYMAHARTVIEPAAGLTVLIGPNNCGKSAIIHALEMICYNSDAADYAIRHGAKKAVVTVETEDDDGTVHTICWWRKERTAGYIIDGREISGLGKGKTPDDLHQYLKMPMIESGAGETNSCCILVCRSRRSSCWMTRRRGRHNFSPAPPMPTS